MKVYTAFNHTYTKIFSTREKAIDYIVKKWLIESNQRETKYLAHH